MYNPSDSKEYNSPSAYGTQGADDGGPLQTIQYFLEDHGKKIVFLIILAIVAFFAWDFFVGSYRHVGFDIQNTEGQPIEDASISITKNGESKIQYAGAPTTQSLKTGSYSIRVTAAQYREKTTEFTVDKDNDTVTIQLEKALATKITSTDFPSELYLGQTTSATVTLQNTGSKDESIELAFEGDFKTLIENGANFSSTPPIITMAGNATQTIPIMIQIPNTIKLKNPKQGDAKKGSIKIRYTTATSAKKEIAFQLLPEPSISVLPTKIEKTVTAGTINESLGKISIKNKGTLAAKNVSVSVELDNPPTSDAVGWFSFSEEQLNSLDPNESRDIQLYITTPVSANTVSMAGQSHILIKGETWQQTIPLKITVTGVQTALSATLSVSGNTTVSIPQKSDGTYEIISGKNVTIKNNGGVTITNIELVNYSATCRDSWIIFDQTPTIASIEPKASQPIGFLITAPQAAPIDTLRTCEFRVRYTDPLTNADKEINTTPAVIRLKTTG